MLAILQVRGVAADLSLAHDWYKKASELGSQEAQERLKLLASAKVDDGGPVALGRVEVSRNVNQESAAKDKKAEPISAKPRYAAANSRAGIASRSSRSLCHRKPGWRGPRSEHPRAVAPRRCRSRGRHRRSPASRQPR
jgi:hypothetical protein